MDSVTNQFSGLTFSNATVLTTGTSLNEFENPPHSGGNVIFDDSGAMSITIAAGVTSFSGYFTYGELAPQSFTHLLLQGFDSANNLVTSVSSPFSNNQAFSGDAGSKPNELLQLSYAPGIYNIVITGDPLGASFTADDLAFTTLPTAVPEPSTVHLFLMGTACLIAFRKAHLL